MLLFILAFLISQSSYSQNETADLNSAPPITTTGISLPQLITTDLNRSNLQFGINLTDGLYHPHLSTNYEKFISDNNSQFSITGGLQLRHRFSFETDAEDFYTFQSAIANFGADLKFFNANDYYIQVATDNSINKFGGISDFNTINTYNSISLGIGKGRVNYSDDGAAIIAIIDKLKKYGFIKREVTEKEYLTLVEKIRVLKNRRKFVNRSYPLTEVEEIQDELSTLGLIEEGINITEIINDVYRFEPLIDRRVGSQFGIVATASFVHSDFVNGYNTYSITTKIGYDRYVPINSKLQFNQGVSGYIAASKFKNEDQNFDEDRFSRLGVQINNEFHYLVDTRMRISAFGRVGHDFVHKLYLNNSLGDPYFDLEGFFLNLGGELRYQITRTTSATVGINLNITPRYNSSGIHFGLNF